MPARWGISMGVFGLVTWNMHYADKMEQAIAALERCCENFVTQISCFSKKLMLRG